ncbi:hypothetical protein BDQ12DRAFT_728944 [Crucibulum laeve]|uniref:CBM21 domain-containing protein n=1 Tax=Crucibulum laeve TaxID=68775 RepID=A0A5C3LG69_9AGAR|nr:hypothetical protein BDQ12DRAFT_728944 [Crucibulum laeve]
MPYSTPAPAPAPLPVHSHGRPGHRRSYSSAHFAHSPANSHGSHSTPAVFSNERGPGAFAPLGGLPRRRSSAAVPSSGNSNSSSSSSSNSSSSVALNNSAVADTPTTTVPGKPILTPAGPKFHFRTDDSDDSSDEQVPSTTDEHDEPAAPVKMKLKPNTNFQLEINTSAPPSPSIANGIAAFRLGGANDEDAPPSPPALMRTSPTPTVSGGAVPFPRSSPLSPLPTAQGGSVPFPMSRSASSGPQSPLPRPGLTSPRPSFSRTASSPILLSNGKPLKSSLKSSSSSPNIPFPPQSLVPSLHQGGLHTHHLRARSAPSTPHIARARSTSDSPLHTSSIPHSPTDENGEEEEYPHSDEHPYTPMPKNVHFPSQDKELQTVKWFNRSAKPASLSKPPGEPETETETEGEGGFGGSLAGAGGSKWGAGGYIRGSAYPFPRFSAAGASGMVGGAQGTAQGAGAGKKFELDQERTSAIPARNPPQYANVHLESLDFSLVPSSSTQGQGPLALTGTLLVRNLAYEKHVAVRFTLDDWQTTSEVSAHHVISLPCLPASFPSTSLPGSHAHNTSGDLAGDLADAAGRAQEASHPAWDRFSFNIKLEDYRPSLLTRTMWLVARYTSGSGGGQQEWWDNNKGGNYRVGFKEGVVVKEEAGKRKVAISAPPAYAPPSAPAMGYSISSPPTVSGGGAHPYHHSYPTTSTSSFTAGATPTSSQGANSAFAQTTLSRLKKLNLRNYAAPSTSPTAPPSLSTSTPPSTTNGSQGSSPATSPLHTPTDHMPLSPTSTTTQPMPMGLVNGYPASLGMGFMNMNGMGGEAGMSSSPPFSSMGMRAGSPSLGSPVAAGVPAAVRGGQGAVYWPWGSSTASSSSNVSTPTGEAKVDNAKQDEGEGVTTPTQEIVSSLVSSSSSSTPAQEAQENKDAKPSDKDTASKGEQPKHLKLIVPTDHKEDVSDKKPAVAVPASLLLDIKEKSTSSPPRSPVKSTIGGSSSSSRNSSFESLDDGRVRLGNGLRRQGGTESPLRRSVLGLGLEFSPSQGSHSNGYSSTSPARSPRISPVHSNRTTPSGSPANSARSSPLASPSLSSSTLAPPSLLPHSNLSASTTPSGSPAPSTPNGEEVKDPDALYQAFVRQWCFAQGPGPAVGPGVVVG